jgi:predicted PurR-regulated permease PerM
LNHRGSHPSPRPKSGAAAQGEFLPRLAWLTIIAGGLLLLCYYARVVVLPILLALVGSMALKPPVNWLRKRHLPGPVAAGLVLATLIATLVCGLINLGRPVAEWVKSAPETLPRLRQKYQRLFAPISRVEAALDGADGKSNEGKNNSPPAAAAPAAGGSQLAGTLFTWTGSVLGCTVETAVLLFVLVAAGDRFIDKFAQILPRVSDDIDTAELGREIQQNISTYLFTVSLINIVLGAAVGVSLSLAEMPNPVMWGVFAAVINYVPYFGPVVGIIVVAGAGLLVFDTAGHGLIPAGAYLLWHLLEADVVTPFLLGRKFRMNAFVIFIMLMFCAWLWGLPGALLAMPLLVSIKVVAGHVPALTPLAEFLSA